MSDLNEIVGDDVNVTQPEQQAEQPAPEQPEQQPEQQEPEQPRVVPLAALHEERTRRKELAAQLAAAEARQRELEARVEARLAALAKANEPQPPSFEENPALALKHGLDTVTQTLQEQQEARRQELAQRQQVEYVQRAAVTVQQYEAQVAAEKPDYQKAVDYMRDLRAREFEVMGMDPDSARVQAAREMVEGALQNAARGINPAQLVYKMAELRGYKPAGQQPSVTERFDTQARGTAAAKSLGGGGAVRGQLSAQQLLSLSDEEFAEATKGDNWRKVAGG